MAVNPQILQTIADPTGGRLGDIGQTYADARQRKIENERQAGSDKMKADAFQLEMADVGSKVMGAYSNNALDWKKANPDKSDEDFASYQLELWSQLNPAHQQLVPQGFQTTAELEQGIKNSENMQKALHPELYKVDENKLNKWETELTMIQSKNENPKAWTETKQEQLEALQRQTLLPVSMGRPSKTEDMFSKQSLKVLKKNDDVLENNIENESAYTQDLAAEKRKLMEERELLVRQKKETKLLSDAEATQLAHEKLKDHLHESDTLFEMTGFVNPLGKKYIYAPNKGKKEQPSVTTENKLSESQMLSVLKGNDLEDTPENRELINKQYSE